MTRTTKKALDRMLSQLTAPPRRSSVLHRPAANSNRNGRPIRAPIRTGHCSGCNVRIPSGQLQRALAGKTIQCEHCHRVLYIERD